jgi:hypothetical protein
MQCECGNPDVVKECHDCGKKLCRSHIKMCCDLPHCEFCLELHQTSEDHVPLGELVA